MLKASVKNMEGVIKQLNKMEDGSMKAVKKTTKEFTRKNRGPAWVAGAIKEVYNIKSPRINKAIKGGKVKSVIKVKGKKVDNAQIIYRDRLLTPTNFNMKPKKRPKKKGKNPITAEIIKGQRKVLSSKAFLADNGYGTDIPFQRSGKGRLPIKVIKTVSVPQMVTNKKVAPKIQKNISVNMQKRLEYHTKQELGKN